jgi:hypothetical protein
MASQHIVTWPRRPYRILAFCLRRLVVIRTGLRGEASHPVVAIIRTNANPDADSLGFTLSVITIVSLLVNRLARPVITPMPSAGTGWSASATYCRVTKSASA